MKRIHVDDQFNYPITKNLKRLTDYEQQRQLITCDWPLKHRKKLKTTSEKEEQQFYNSQVYLTFFRSTLKCSIYVIIQPINKFINYNEQTDSILIGQSRIPKILKTGVIRIRLVSSLFGPDTDVNEDPSLSKLETIKIQSYQNNIDKQFALLLKKNVIGPGTIGKLLIESLDPSNGSYTSNPPIFELNLNLESKHEIVLTSSSHQNFQNQSSENLSFQCGCVLSCDQCSIKISDQCNLMLNDTKLVHRLSEPLRCLWKSIGRELFPCFSEIDLNDLNQKYFLSEGNHECTYQLLREWFIRAPNQANIRYLLTQLKLPYHILMTIHNDVVKQFLS